MNNNILEKLKKLSPHKYWEKILKNKEDILKKSRKINSSSESNIFLYENSIILKKPKNNFYQENILKSCYIGKILNNLINLIPNFPQTFGFFQDKNYIVVQEYINGETLYSLLKKKKLNFNEFLSIFIQILFALEIAQRQFRFCHYDLHLQNIFLKKIKEPYTYNVYIDDKKYTIKAEKYIPIIIDFGFSSIFFENETIGSKNMTKYGIFYFHIQGVDMYKLLFHSYAKTIGEKINMDIRKLFDFYQNEDPYQILLIKPEKIPDISKTFLKNVPYSKAATKTPFEMIRWIMNNYNLNIFISERDLFLPAKNLNIKIDNVSSFLLKKYINKINCENKDCEIENDNKDDKDEIMLNFYKKIKIPEKIIENCNLILNCKLGEKKMSLDSDFLEKMNNFFFLYYIIKELNLEDKYKNFIFEFKKSKQYEFYQKFSFLIEKTKRWETTLELGSDKSCS